MIGQIDKGGKAMFARVANYHFDKIEDGVAKIIDSNIPIEERRFVIDTLNQSVNYRNKDVAEPVFHMSINLSPGEGLMDDDWRKVVNNTLDGLGYDDNSYIAFHHSDKEHEHVHILATRIKFSGELVHSKQDYKKGEEIMRKAEKQFGLIEVVSSKDVKEKKVMMGQKEKAMLEHQYGNALKKGLNSSDIHPVVKLEGEFLKNKGLDLMNNNQIKDKDIKEVFESVPGARHRYRALQNVLEKEGLVNFSKKQEMQFVLRTAYQLTNSKHSYEEFVKSHGYYARVVRGGYRYGIGNWYINEDKMAKRYRLDSVNKLSDKKRDFYGKDVKIGIRGIVLESLKTVKSKEEFEKYLNQYSIQVKFAENSGGVYGVSFRPDYFQNDYIKSSDIDRDLSWTRIREMMLQNTIYNIDLEKQTLNEEGKVVDKTKASSDSGFDFGNVNAPGNAGGTDPNDQEEKEKKKKKRKRGM